MSNYRLEKVLWNGIIFLLFLFSCESNKVIDDNFRNAYTISVSEGKYLCVILGGGKNCSPCQRFIESLENFSYFLCSVNRNT